MSEFEISQLRKFGLTLGFIFISLFGVLLPYISKHITPWWPWLSAGVLIALSLLRAPWLRYIYSPWMKLGHILGWINTRLILGILFFCVILPMGIIRRCLGKDSMARNFDKNLTTYRILCFKKTKEQMERPF